MIETVEPSFPPLVQQRSPLPVWVMGNETPVSVICPVYNQIEVTIDFVLNMLAWVKPPHELIIVANGCTDATPAFLAQMKRANHNINPIISERNRGFGGGNNFGAREAKNPIHIFLSNDVRAHGDFIAPIVKELTYYPRTVVGAKKLSHDTGWNTYTVTKDIYWYGRIVAAAGHKLTIPYIEGWCVAVRKHYHHMNRPQDKSQTDGLWDERYFPCDFEDLDVSMQAQVDAAGLAELELPLEHRSTGQTANLIPGGRLPITLRNQKLFMEKWGLSLP